jgi:hypothetical protein
VKTIIEKIKSVPPVLWIGVALAVLVVIYLSSKSSAAAAEAASTPTSATVGTPSGTAVNGVSTSTLPNPTQSGMDQLASLETGGGGSSFFGSQPNMAVSNPNTGLTSGLASTMNGGTSMAHFGHAITNAGTSVSGITGAPITISVNNNENPSSPATSSQAPVTSTRPVGGTNPAHIPFVFPSMEPPTPQHLPNMQHLPGGSAVVTSPVHLPATPAIYNASTPTS